MIFRIEIDTETKSGCKIYEFIESLSDRNGIKYTDYTDDYFMTEDELDELGNQIIQELEDECSHSNKKSQILKKSTKRIQRDKSVAGL